MEKRSPWYNFLADSISWPPVKEQLFNSQGHVTSAQEFTGAVYCPQRFSHLSVGRCGQYQREFACGDGCPSAVSKKDIKAIESAARTDDECGRGTKICAECGGRKVRVYSEFCSPCEILTNQNERRETKRHRREMKFKRR